MNRKRMPFPELLIWRRVRKRHLGGFKIRRQHVLGPFIVDFICLEQKLVIEIDGMSHRGRKSQDADRQRYVESKGFRVIRFFNDDVLEDPDAVTASILRALREQQRRK